MTEFLKFFTNIINIFHDETINLMNNIGVPITDKQLHFLFIGVLGMILFACTQVLFKFLAKISISAISFVYTLTVLLFITFAIEIQQEVLNRGTMDFGDVVYGLCGFLCILGGWLAIKWTISFVKKAVAFLEKINF